MAATIFYYFLIPVDETKESKYEQTPYVSIDYLGDVADIVTIDGVDYIIADFTYENQVLVK